MFNKRSVLLMLMLFILSALLVACGGAAPAVQEAAEEVEQAAEEVVEEVEEAAEEAMEEEAMEEEAMEEEAMEEEAMVATCEDALGCISVAEGDAIKIASALVIAGPNETLGVDSQRGVEIAIADRGQVAGHDVELQAEDGGCSAEGGQTAAQKIASDEAIVAVVGHNCSSSCTPAAPIYNDAGSVDDLPQSCTAPSLTGDGTHVESLLQNRPQRQHSRASDG